MSTSPDPRTVLRDPVHLVAFGFGLGLAPRAPGTVGTLLGVVLHLLTMELPLAWRVTGITLAFLLGVWVCGESARRLGTPDHGGIVWDEVVGVLIALIVVPPGWMGVVAGFLLFRLLDIWKPWPIRLADRRVHGGFGIMLDDALAGGGAAVMLGLANHFGVL
jgi:phosphatidylglycerophosphatase A